MNELKKSEYLKNNPNTRGIKESYWTEERVEKAKNRVLEKDWVGTTDNDFEVKVNGKRFSLEYEEMVELLKAMDTCVLGNEAFVTAKLKSDVMGEYLPVTDY